MARTARVTLFEREVREKLSQSAIEILLGAATVLSEGERAPSVRGAPSPSPSPLDDRWFGSTMLTIELARVAGAVRDEADAHTARRLAALVADDRRFTDALTRIVTREAERLLGTPPRALSTDVRVRTEGATLFVDVDWEAARP